MKAYIVDAVFICLFLFLTCWCAYWSYQQEKRTKKDVNELVRLKAAMFKVGIEDFIELPNGSIEVKMVKP